MILVILLLLIPLNVQAFSCKEEKWEIDLSTKQPVKIVEIYKAKQFKYLFDAQRYSNINKIPTEYILKNENGYSVFNKDPKNINTCVFLTNGESNE